MYLIALLCFFFFTLLSMQKNFFPPKLPQYFTAILSSFPIPLHLFLSLCYPPFDFKFLTRIQMLPLLLKCIIKKKKKSVCSNYLPIHGTVIDLKQFPQRKRCLDWAETVTCDRNTCKKTSVFKSYNFCKCFICYLRFVPHCQAEMWYIKLFQI